MARRSTALPRLPTYLEALLDASSGADLRTIVELIESTYREKFGLVGVSDRAIEEMHLSRRRDGEQLNANELAGVRVIDLCGWVREAHESSKALDMALARLRLALHDADPDRLRGIATRAGGAKGAAIANPHRERAAAQQDAALLRDAKKMLAQGRSVSDVARILADRGGRGRESLRKKLGQLLKNS